MGVSSPRANRAESAEVHHVIGGPSRKFGVDNKTLPKSADNRRDTQLHHVEGRHFGTATHRVSKPPTDTLALKEP